MVIVAHDECRDCSGIRYKVLGYRVFGRFALCFLECVNCGNHARMLMVLEKRREVC